MRLFNWSSSNAVFVPKLDADHRTIFEVTGELQQALRGHATPFEVQEILRRLIAAAEDHFAYEEKLMRESSYPMAEWHRKQHETARKHMREAAPPIEGGDVEAGNRLVEFLSGWLEDHTTVTDRMMAAYLRNQDRARLS